MAKWYERNNNQLELASCRLCNGKFYYDEAQQVTECPRCHYSGKSKEEEDNIKRLAKRLK